MNNKYILIGVLTAILLLSLVRADQTATISPNGLSSADAQLTSIFGKFQCLANIDCVVVQGLESTITKEYPQASAIISTYQKVQGVISQGGQITNNLTVNQDGTIADGTISFGKNQTFITPLLGNNITNQEVSVSNCNLDINGSNNVVTTGGNDSYLIIGNDNSRNTYQNVQENSTFQLDDSGDIIGANITSAGDTSLTFYNQTLDIGRNTSVIYSNGSTLVKGLPGTNFNDRDDYSGINFTKSLTILDQNGVMIDGNNFSGTDFNISGVEVSGIGNNISGTLSVLDQGSLLGNGTIAFLNNSGVNANSSSVLLVNSGQSLNNLSYNYVSLNGGALQAKGENFSLNLYSGNPWIDIGNNSQLILTPDNNISFNILQSEIINQSLFSAPYSLVSVTPGDNGSALNINNGGNYVVRYPSNSAPELSSVLGSYNNSVNPAQIVIAANSPNGQNILGSIIGAEMQLNNQTGQVLEYLANSSFNPSSITETNISQAAGDYFYTNTNITGLQYLNPYASLTKIMIISSRYMGSHY